MIGAAADYRCVTCRQFRGTPAGDGSEDWYWLVNQDWPIPRVGPFCCAPCARSFQHDSPFRQLISIMGDLLAKAAWGLTFRTRRRETGPVIGFELIDAPSVCVLVAMTEGGPVAMEYGETGPVARSMASVELDGPLTARLVWRELGEETL